MIEAVDEILTDYVMRVFELSQENLISEEKIDTAMLFKTANINIDGNEKTIVYPANHASFVHDGRDKGSMPPTQPLEGWVRRKLGIRDPKKVKRVAFAIAKAIEERGITQSPFLERAIDQSNKEFNLTIVTGA